ncbi:MAG: ABC transporter permease, partial [Streptosporangiaceae bacterium]
MSTISLAARDSATMLRRDARHSLQAPAMLVSGMVVPLVFLLLYAGVFGHALSADIGARPGTRYINFLAPGILVMTVGFAAEGTAINVCNDMAQGI